MADPRQSDDAVRAEIERLTRGEKAALGWLAGLHSKFPDNTYGFNPTYRAKHAAACRRSLEARGYVQINRLSERHFRYRLTDAGRAVAATLQEPRP